MIYENPPEIYLDTGVPRLSLKPGTRGFPSHDFSWFDFIGNFNVKWAISMPRQKELLNPLILLDFSNIEFFENPKNDIFCHTTTSIYTLYLFYVDLCRIRVSPQN